MIIWQIIALVVLLSLSGFFSGIEVALVSIRKVKLRHFLKTNRRGARALKKLKENPRRMIITILIGNNIVNVSASVLASVMATEIFGSKGAGIAIGVMTFLILIFGEITPKSYASIYFSTISLMVARPLLIFQKIIYPLILFFEWLPRILLKFTNKEPDESKSVTEKELKTAFEVGVEERSIRKSEKELLKNVLEFDDIPAKEVMTEDNNMFTIDADTLIKDSLEYFEDCPYSRVPIFRESRNNIVGIVHVKEILEAIIEEEENLKLIDIAYKPFFVEEDIIIADLFKEFQKRHIHMAIVRNKNNDIKGVVTIEDLLEEIVGEIIDESDVTPNQIKRINKNTILVDGESKINYVNSFFNINIPLKYANISEYLTERKEGEFKRGEQIKVGNIKFTVEEMGEDKIERVVIEKE